MEWSSDWSRDGKVAALFLAIVLVVVIVPVLFVYNDYPEVPWWDVVAFFICISMPLLGGCIASECKTKRSWWKNKDVGVFFVLSAAVIACSAGGYVVTQDNLDRMQFTALVCNQPVNLLSGSQAWNYTMTRDANDDYLIIIDGYAAAPCGTWAWLQYQWTICQDGTLMASGDVNIDAMASCSDDNTPNRDARSQSYIFGFKNVERLNISIVFTGTSHPENSEESISFSVYATKGFSKAWIQQDEILFHFYFPLDLCAASAVIAIIGLLGVGIWRTRAARKVGRTETVWKAP